MYHIWFTGQFSYQLYYVHVSYLSKDILQFKAHFLLDVADQNQFLVYGRSKNIVSFKKKKNKKPSWFFVVSMFFSLSKSITKIDIQVKQKHGIYIVYLVK